MTVVHVGKTAPPAILSDGRVITFFSKTIGGYYTSISNYYAVNNTLRYSLTLNPTYRTFCFSRSYPQSSNTSIAPVVYAPEDGVPNCLFEVISPNISMSSDGIYELTFWSNVTDLNHLANGYNQNYIIKFNESTDILPTTSGTISKILCSAKITWEMLKHQNSSLGYDSYTFLTPVIRKINIISIISDGIFITDFSYVPTPASIYDGPFAVVTASIPGTPTEEDPEPLPIPILVVCLGSNPLNPIAGTINFQEFVGYDNPFPTQIEALRTELPATNGDVYLIVRFDPAGNFTYEFYQGPITSCPDYGNADMWYKRLATYNSTTNIVTQIHKDGDITITGQSNRYLGAFKAIYDWSNDKIIICNGSNYGSASCGYVGPSPVSIAVPRTELTATDGRISLLITYSGGAYSANFIQGTYAAAINEYLVPIATYYASNHSITQLHTTGNISIVGRWL